jgi:excisionase family DNA binding protein
MMRLLSADEASTYLGVPKATLAKMRWAGKGCRFVKLGRKVYYRPADLDDWIAANERSSTSDA